ncbi:DNA polymerase-1 [Thermodesulfobium acidiphilum]|uniref:DNA polymerase-1 n=1 Tax=Thermodesulfobium acidiphilum TaxID=1794699 RepID=A0A2R4W0I5_THEAF|nr:5'-3' exonuclease H3TH domain-containing protein [Thermodesulfobium acidiphilum]AWB10319.1 DNA polymerase-1 [Thermodesulfobium acidiphilum]
MKNLFDLERTICLIDAHSVIYRAYYALPELTSQTGIPTNALYGFINILLKLIKEEDPYTIFVAFDSPEKTFRHESFKEYKASRPKMPESLISQVLLIKEFLKLMNIRFYEIPGYESDDLVASMAKQILKKDYDVLILTGDFDLLQLVSERVKVLIMKKGISDVEKYDLDKFLTKFGIKPIQIVDMKALCGDSSDEIPGVKGIGKKTAIEILREFNTVEDLLKNIDRLKNERYKKLIYENREKIIFYKSITLLDSDVSLEIEIQEKPWENLSDEQRESLKRFLESLDLKSIQKKLFS